MQHTSPWRTVARAYFQKLFVIWVSYMQTKVFQKWPLIPNTSAAHLLHFSRGLDFFPESAGILTLDDRLCNGTTWSPFISLNLLAGNAHKGNFRAFAFFLLLLLLTIFFSFIWIFFFVSSGYCFAGCFHCPLNSDNVMWIYAISSYSDSYLFSLHPWFVFSYSYSL